MSFGLSICLSASRETWKAGIGFQRALSEHLSHLVGLEAGISALHLRNQPDLK